MPCWCSLIFSMMTMVTPLSAVSTALDVSCFKLCQCPAFLHGEVSFVVVVVIPKNAADISSEFICFPGGSLSKLLLWL